MIYRYKINYKSIGGSSSSSSTSRFSIEDLIFPFNMSNLEKTRHFLEINKITNYDELNNYLEINRISLKEKDISKGISSSSSSKPISSSLNSSKPSLNAIDDIYNDFTFIINTLTDSDIISISKTIDPKIKKDHVIEIKKIFNGSEEDMEKINNLFTYLRNNKIIINEKLILKYYHKLLYIQPIINELEHSSIVSESKKIINEETKSTHVENIKKIFNESFKPIVISLSKEEIKRKMNNLFTYLKENEISIREIYYPLKYIFDNDSLRRAVNLWVSDKSKAIELYNDINTWDVSQVTDMSKLFQYKYDFNDNISEWDTSNVKDMSSMFTYTRSFNQPLNRWNVSNVTNMSRMFEDAKIFNQSLNRWNVSNVKDMSSMFRSTKLFNENISYWDTSNVTNMSRMFSAAINFDKDIYTRVLPDGKIAWDVSNVTNMENMFGFTKSFNGNISNWNTSKVTNMSSMFNHTDKFDGKISIKYLSTPISSSSSSSISSSSNLKFDDLTFPESMRFGATKVNHFNQIKKINKEKEIDKYLIDNGISIKEDYNKTSSSSNPNNSENKLSDMYGIIKAIDGDLKIQNINTKIVVNTKNEYLYTAWDVSNVEDISNMFERTKLFDGDISKWNISNVSNMKNLFSGASIFNRDINTENITINNNTYTAWDVSRIENMHGIFSSTEKFNGNIDMWNTSNVTDMSAMFSRAKAFNKDIYTRVLPNGKIAWDVSKVNNMYYMFAYTEVFNGNIINWDTSNVVNMKYMFYYAKQFDGDINTKPIEDVNGNTVYRAWNVSRVIDMSEMFNRAESFNKDINDWDTSNVNDMRLMFGSAIKFNQNLSSKRVTNKNNEFLYLAWKVNNVLDMFRMFYNAISFNGQIKLWDTSNVMNMKEMFSGAINFKDPSIGIWRIRYNAVTTNMFHRSGIIPEIFIDEKGNNIEPYRSKFAEILGIEPNYMTIFVKTLTGRTFVININPFDRIEKIKREIQNADQDNPIERQRLIYNGQQLENEREIIFYEIRNESTIHLVLTIR